jgi:hypothetical protein
MPKVITHLDYNKYKALIFKVLKKEELIDRHLLKINL